MDLKKILNDAGIPAENDLVSPYAGRVLTPQGVMNHHTVSSPPAAFPSLSVVKYGRSDLPGPLCSLLLGRYGEGYKVICNGYSNHAGWASQDAYARWQAKQRPRRATSSQFVGNGNYEFIGIEAENNGTGEPWSDEQLHWYIQGNAALCNYFGWDPFTRVWQHKEWVSQKIDTAFITPPISPDEFRQAVWEAMVGQDNPTPEPEPESINMAVLDG